MNNNTIKVISFDLDDTLWPLRETLEYAEQDYFHWLCQQYPLLAAQHSLLTMRDYRQLFLQQHPTLRQIGIAIGNRDQTIVLSELAQHGAAFRVGGYFIAINQKALEASLADVRRIITAELCQ